MNTKSLDSVILKSLLSFAFFVSCAISAEGRNVMKLMTYEYSVGVKNKLTHNYMWGDWEPFQAKVTVYMDQDLIVLHTPKTQRFKVVSCKHEYTTLNGGFSLTFGVQNDSGQKGTIELSRLERDNFESIMTFHIGRKAWRVKVTRKE